MSSLAAVGHAQVCLPEFGCFGGKGIVDVSVTTDQSSYVVGDPITYSIIATNLTPEPVLLQWFDSRQADFLVDGIYSPDDIALQVLTSREVPANGSVSWDFEHPWNRYSMQPGSHSIIGEVVDYGVSDPHEFSVTAPDPVTDDVFIDFETLPNGNPTHDGNDRTYGLWHNAFIRHGVEFHSRQDSVNLTLGNGGAMLRTWRAPDNIEAEFHIPVYSVTADVGSAAGRTVTMEAFDSLGRLLGSVTSDPVTDYPSLVGPLSFDSTVPIASVEWTSSTSNAALFVDNLFLNVDLSETHGDFNADGRSDAADYVVWRNLQGQSVPLGAAADGNHDGMIDESDWEIWRNKFGWRSGLRESSVTVPEPSTAKLLALFALAGFRCRKRAKLRQSPANVCIQASMSWSRLSAVGKP